MDIEEESYAQEYNNETDNKSRYQNQNISVESSISQIFVSKEPRQMEIGGEVQENLCLLFNINTIPETILKQFKRARWIKPL